MNNVERDIRNLCYEEPAEVQQEIKSLGINSVVVGKEAIIYDQDQQISVYKFYMSTLILPTICTLSLVILICMQLLVSYILGPDFSFENGLGTGFFYLFLVLIFLQCIGTNPYHKKRMFSTEMFNVSNTPNTKLKESKKITSIKYKTMDKDVQDILGCLSKNLNDLSKYLKAAGIAYTGLCVFIIFFLVVSLFLQIKDIKVIGATIKDNFIFANPKLYTHSFIHPAWQKAFLQVLQIFLYLLLSLSYLSTQIYIRSWLKAKCFFCLIVFFLSFIYILWNMLLDIYTGTKDLFKIWWVVRKPCIEIYLHLLYFSYIFYFDMRMKYEKIKEKKDFNPYRDTHITFISTISGFFLLLIILNGLLNFYFNDIYLKKSIILLGKI